MKFSCLLPAAGVAVGGFAVAIGRLLLARRVHLRKGVVTYPPAPLEDDIVLGSARADAPPVPLDGATDSMCPT